MLNTESRVVALLVWISIWLILLVAAWSLFQWPSPAELWGMFLNSHWPQTIFKYQTLIGLVFSSMTIALAIFVSGWYQRNIEVSGNADFQNKFLKAFEFELDDLSRECKEVSMDALEISQVLQSAGPTSIGDVIAEVDNKLRDFDPSENLLMSLTREDFLDLDAGLFGSLKFLRNRVAALDSRISSVLDKNVSSSDSKLRFEKLARDSITVSLICDRVVRHMRLSSNDRAQLGQHDQSRPHISEREVEAALHSVQSQGNAEHNRPIANAAE